RGPEASRVGTRLPAVGRALRSLAGKPVQYNRLPRPVRSSPAMSAPARPIEGHPSIAQRHVRVMADHEVVEQVDVEQATGSQRLGRQVQVVGRGRRVARWMVVDEDRSRRVEPDRVAIELADAYQ